MNDIEDLMYNGNWTRACEEFHALNMSERDFQHELETGNYKLLNWSLLGFYSLKDT